MEAIFIIYAISWLIFLAIYIGYSLKFKEESLLKKFKWYELVLMFLFAPIVLFFFFVS